MKNSFLFMVAACILYIMFGAKHATCSVISFCCRPLCLLGKSERYNVPMALFQTTPLSRILILWLARHFSVGHRYLEFPLSLFSYFEHWKHYFALLILLRIIFSFFYRAYYSKNRKSGFQIFSTALNIDINKTNKSKSRHTSL